MATTAPPPPGSLRQLVLGRKDAQDLSDTEQELPPDLMTVNMGPSHPAMHGTVRIVLTGPIERDLSYEVIGGRATQVDTPSAPPVATVTMDSDAFATLALGRRPATAYQDRISIDGDRALGARVADQLNMMI